jgi:hypothetical protein
VYFHSANATKTGGGSVCLYEQDESWECMFIRPRRELGVYVYTTKTGVGSVCLGQARALAAVREVASRCCEGDELSLL